MSKELPNQLRWKDFTKVLKRMGYELLYNKRGAARVFRNQNREPELVTFHEPHHPKTLRKGTLSSYISKLDITNEEFNSILNGDKVH